MTDRLRVATYDSKTAIAQARLLARELSESWPGVTVEVLVVDEAGGVHDASTLGGVADTSERGPAANTSAHRPQRSSSQTGPAVTAVRRAVEGGEADVAVLEFRWLPLGLPDGLRLGAVPMRRDPRDVLVTRTDTVLTYLPPGTRIGAPEPHRRAQLLRRRSDLEIAPAPVGLTERLEYLETGEVDGVVVPAADLAALGLLDVITEYFDTDQLIPAPCQGAIALEIREGDNETSRRIALLDDEPTAYAVAAERACVRRLRPEPHLPLGVFALTDGEIMFIHGIIATEDGRQCARLRWTGPWREAVDVGETLAELLLSVGGAEIMAGEPIETIDFAKQHKQRIIDSWDLPYPPEEA